RGPHLGRHHRQPAQRAREQRHRRRGRLPGRRQRRGRVPVDVRRQDLGALRQGPARRSHHLSQLPRGHPHRAGGDLRPRHLPARAAPLPGPELSHGAHGGARQGSAGVLQRPALTMTRRRPPGVAGRRRRRVRPARRDARRAARSTLCGTCVTPTACVRVKVTPPDRTTAVGAGSRARHAANPVGRRTAVANRTFSRLLALLAVLALLLAACGGGDDGGETTDTGTEGGGEESTEGGDDAAAGGGGDLIVGTTDTVPTVDPAKCYSYYCSNILQNVGNTLVSFAPGESEPSPQIAAEMPEISEDGLSYTFTLQEGLTFHDGSELTSEDV